MGKVVFWENSNLGKTYVKNVGNITIPASAWTDVNIDLPLDPGTYVIVCSCKIEGQYGKYVGWQMYSKSNSYEIGRRGVIVPPDNNIFWGQSSAFLSINASTAITVRCWTATGIEGVYMYLDALKIK